MNRISVKMNYSCTLTLALQRYYNLSKLQYVPLNFNTDLTFICQIILFCSIKVCISVKFIKNRCTFNTLLVDFKW